MANSTQDNRHLTLCLKNISTKIQLMAELNVAWVASDHRHFVRPPPGADSGMPWRRHWPESRPQWQTRTRKAKSAAASFDDAYAFIFLGLLVFMCTCVCICLKKERCRRSFINSPL